MRIVLVGLCAGMICLAGCERGETPRSAEPQGAAAPEAVAPVEPTWTPPQIPNAAKAPPAKPLGMPTGTFVDRPAGAQLRLVSYNVLWNNMFAEVSEGNADKFVRVMRALNPDVVALQEIGVTSWMRDKDPMARDWSARDVVHVMNAALPLSGGMSWEAHKAYDMVIASRYPLTMQATNTDPAGDREQAMALVDLPDGRFQCDLYVMNNHYKCCDPEKYDKRRQRQSDAIVNWVRDARTPGGNIDLPEGSAIAVVGDLNIVGSFQPVQTLLDGDIIDEEKYGEDFPPDWDDTDMTDAHPLHNIDGPDDYTWRSDDQEEKRGFGPSRMDYIVYTDSVLEVVQKFVLNTTTMSQDTLAAAGLTTYDVTVDDVGREYDHLPLVADFRVRSGAAGE